LGLSFHNNFFSFLSVARNLRIHGDQTIKLFCISDYSGIKIVDLPAHTDVPSQKGACNTIRWKINPCAHICTCQRERWLGPGARGVAGAPTPSFGVVISGSGTRNGLFQ